MEFLDNISQGEELNWFKFYLETLKTFVSKHLSAAGFNLTFLQSGLLKTIFPTFAIPILVNIHEYQVNKTKSKVFSLERIYKFCIKKIFQKKFQVRKTFCVRKEISKKKFGSEKFWSEKILVKKNFGSKKFWFKFFLGTNKIFGL